MTDFLATTPPYVVFVLVVAVLSLLLIAGLLVWAFLWPIDESQCECCAEETYVPGVSHEDHD